MFTYDPPVAEYRFLLRDVIRAEDWRKLRGYDMTNDASLVAVLEPLARFARDRVLPLRQAADAEGARLQPDGTVTTPRGYKAVYDAYVADGWPALGGPAEVGGHDAPSVVSSAQIEFLNATGQSFAMYLGWGDSLSKILMRHGTQEQRDRYLTKLVSGEWAGTMALTEPHCGTDLGQLRTRAVPQADGSYAISGTKIFNSGGEHDLTPNIIHLVLARIHEAPAGVRGLSLFLMPKHLLDAQGGPAACNGVTCGGIEQKMGLHGSATCTMHYDDATGYLVGEPNKGLPAMFALMNHVRRTIGPISVGVSDIAYQNAAAYVKERRAGRALALAEPDRADADADPLIEQPDVRRVLLTIGSTLDPARALCLWAALQADITERSSDPEERARAETLLGILTPVTKSFLSDLAFTNTVLAQQLFGGHGYVVGSGVEQLVRDVRVLAIAEGANGVQGSDLVQRKLILDGGAAMQDLIEVIEQALAEAKGDVAALVAPVRAALDDLRAATSLLLEVGPGNQQFAAAGASDYLALLGHVLLGYCWIRILAASTSVPSPQRHRQRWARAHFYLSHMLPETGVRLQRVRAGEGVMMLPTTADF